MTQEEFKNEATTLQPDLLREVLHYVRRTEVAEDIVQDCLTRLWAVCDDLHSPMAPLAKVVARNLSLDFVRRTPHTESMADNVPSDADNNGTTAEKHEAIERMMDIVTTLPPMQQAVLRMRHIEGRSMADIALALNMTEAAVRKDLSRARMSVRDTYRKRYEQNAI